MCTTLSEGTPPPTHTGINLVELFPNIKGVQMNFYAATATPKLSCSEWLAGHTMWSGQISRVSWAG